MTALLGAALRRRPLRRSAGVDGQAGFTLIEVMVVIGVISALLLISVPAFLTAQRRAQDHAAQADLHTALEAANTAFADASTVDYSALKAPALAAAETSLRFADNTPVTNRGSVDVVGGSCDIAGSTVGCVALAEPSDNGACWYAVESDNGALYGKGTASGGVCDAADAQNVTLTSDFPA